MKVLNLAVLLSISITSLMASEIDSYTHRSKMFVRDSNSFINKDINARLVGSVAELNEEGINCPGSRQDDDADEVYDIVKDNISSTFIGHSIAVRYEESLPDNKKIFTEWEDSIYRDTTLWQGISLKIKGILSTMKVDGNIIGVDKMGHFFVEGWSFYKRAYLKYDDIRIDKAIKWGQGTERTYFGMTTTGIYSNADLMANFNGMRFWNQLLGFQKDPLRKFKEPILTCKNSKWKLNTKFNFEEYIDAGMDEGVNCNYYDSETIEGHVTSKIRDSFWFKNLFSSNFDFCPVRKSKCEGLATKYGDYSSQLLHKVCYLAN